MLPGRARVRPDQCDPEGGYCLLRRLPPLPKPVFLFVPSRIAQTALRLLCPRCIRSCEGPQAPFGARQLRQERSGAPAVPVAIATAPVAGTASSDGTDRPCRRIARRR